MNTKNKIRSVFALAAIGVGAGVWQYNQTSDEILARISPNSINSNAVDLCVAENLAFYQMADDLLPGNRDGKMVAQTMATMIACQDNQSVPNLIF